MRILARYLQIRAVSYRHLHVNLQIQDTTVTLVEYIEQILQIFCEYRKKLIYFHCECHGYLSEYCKYVI